jgi:hypothetical protein
MRCIPVNQAQKLGRMRGEKIRAKNGKVDTDGAGRIASEIRRRDRH